MSRFVWGRWRLLIDAQITKTMCIVLSVERARCRRTGLSVRPRLLPSYAVFLTSFVTQVSRAPSSIQSILLSHR